MAGLIVAQAPAHASDSLTLDNSKTTTWVEAITPTFHVLHIFGEVTNGGPDPARVIQVTCTLYNGTTVVDTATDNAAADVLLPGESSPFDDLFFSAHLYDHYSCAVTGPSTASHADHNFTTTITSVTTDASNNQHINGSVVNNESVTVQGVNTYLTFYGTTGAVVDTLTVSVNEGDSIQPGLANAVTFNAVRTSNRPTWALSSGLNKLTEAPAPDVSLSASQLNFGAQVIGTTSATQTLTVSNVGTADLTIPAHGVTLNGNNPSDFLVSADQCSGHTVAPDGGTCTVGISFHPTDYGDRSAGVSVADNADGTPQAVTLSGSGLSRAQIGASPAPMAFGLQPAGSTTTSNLTISSTGLDAATITSISLDSGTDFSIPAGTCVGSLAAGSSCSLPVTFSPPASADSDYSDTVTIVAEDSNGHATRNSPVTVGLTGHGSTGSGSVQPGQLAFGPEPVGSTTAAQSVTLTSNGPGPLVISGVHASLGDYTVSNNTCPSSLPNGDSCLISVTFTPAAIGERDGTLVISDNDPGGAATVTLTGSGTQPPTAFYFAEGFTGSGFHEVLSMLAPNQGATATIDYYTNVGRLGPYMVTLPAGHVVLEDVNARIEPLNLTNFNHEVSARVTLSAPGVVERTINFNNGTWHGSTDQVGAPHPATEWDFAEGSTNNAYSEFLTLQNPNAIPVPVTLNYFTDAGAHPVKHLLLAANSRATVLVYSGLPINDSACTTGAAGNCGIGPGIGGVSVQVTSSGGSIVAERPFYVNGFNFGSGTIRDGHDAFGAYAPATDWYFAEGSTLGGFNEYLTLENPGSTDTTARLNYIDNTGKATLKTVTVPKNSRVTVLVFGTASGVGPGITGVSVHVNADLPIVAERPMYSVENFGSGVVAGAHDAVGATALGTLFGFAAGSTLAGDTDFLTIQNPGTTDATVTITYYAGATPITKQVPVAKNTRVTERVGSDVPAGQATVGIVISSTQPILVEKPTYSANTATYGATDAVGYSPSGF
jgi:hypothetical protein